MLESSHIKKKSGYPKNQDIRKIRTEKKQDRENKMTENAKWH